ILGSLADDPGARLVLIAGRLAFDKRQLRLIQALEIVARRRPIGLVLLGEGPERARLEAQARMLPRFHGVTFTRDRAEYSRPLADLGQRARARARRLPSTEDHFRALFELYAARLAVRSPRAE